MDFDFGSPTTIGQVTFTDRQTSGRGNGTPNPGATTDNVTSFDLIFSNDATFDANDVTVSVLSPAPQDTVTTPIGGTTGLTFQFVRFDVTGVSGGNNVGGAEIQFFGAVPEPTALGLLGLGVLRLLARRRRHA